MDADRQIKPRASGHHKEGSEYQLTIHERILSKLRAEAKVSLNRYYL
jgi:hypothetical protein